MKLYILENISEFFGDMILVSTLTMSSLTTMAFISEQTGRQFAGWNVFDAIPLLMMIYVTLRTIVYIERGGLGNGIEKLFDSLKGESE